MSVYTKCIFSIYIHTSNSPPASDKKNNYLKKTKQTFCFLFSQMTIIIIIGKVASYQSLNVLGPHTSHIVECLGDGQLVSREPFYLASCEVFENHTDVAKYLQCLSPVVVQMGQHIFPQTLMIQLARQLQLASLAVTSDGFFYCTYHVHGKEFLKVEYQHGLDQRVFHLIYVVQLKLYNTQKHVHVHHKSPMSIIFLVRGRLWLHQ